LYRLYAGILSRRSRVLDTIFSIPRDASAPRDVLDGISDDHPFQLPPQYINPVNFDHLLTYLLCGPRCELCIHLLHVFQSPYSNVSSEHPTTDEFLVAVLDLSTFLEIEDGIKFTIHEFESRTFFNPILRFYLARRYRIDHWLEPAFRELVNLPVLSLNLSDAERIGLIGFHQVVHTKAELERIRENAAFNCPPMVRSTECTSNDDSTCENAWSSEWWDNFSQLLIHPEVKCDTKYVLYKVETSTIPGMCHKCLDETTRKLKGMGMEEREEKVIMDGVGVIMAHQMDKPIQAAFSVLRSNI